MSLDLIYAVSAPMLLGESPMWHPQEQLLPPVSLVAPRSELWFPAALRFDC